jgi:hypothetical protein
MGNLWSAGRMRPLKLFIATLLRPQKCAYFIEKSNKPEAKVHTLALGMTVLEKFDPRTDLGCPWLSRILYYKMRF